MAKSWYNILGLDNTASDAEVKIKYRQLAKKYHPDVSKHPNAEQIFVIFNKAYNKIINPPYWDIDSFLRAIIRPIKSDKSTPEPKKEQDCNNFLNPDMLQFEKETGKNAVYRGCVTGQFKYWQYNKIKTKYKIKEVIM